MEAKSKKGNMPILVGCVLAYLLTWFIQVRTTQGENQTAVAAFEAMQGLIQRYNIGEDAQSVLGPLEGLKHMKANGIAGVITQFNVLLTVILVITNRKKGFITGTLLNVSSTLYTLITNIIIAHQFQSLPGVVIPLVAVFIAFILYVFLKKNDKMHDDLSESYQQAIENNRLIKEKDEVLSYLAYYDRLTQLPNRQLFMENLEERVKAGSECTVIYVDLDDFKRINDSFGHSTGDELLQEYAKKIEDYCGEESFVAKIGGDEFGIIMRSGYTNDDIINFVNGIGNLLIAPVEIRGDFFRMTASYGAALFPKDARSSEDLFRCAETAMFSAKANGKNQLCFYVRNRASVSEQI